MPSQQPAGMETPPSGGSGKTKSILVAGLIILLLAASGYMYHSIVQKNRQISQLQQENIMGDEEQKKLNNYINEITDTVNEVESKLQDVRNKQVSITGIVTQSENDASKKSQLINDISVIEDQLKKDKKDVAALQGKMKKSNLRIKFLDDMVANLQKEIEKNEKTMAELRATLQEKDQVIKDKDMVIQSKEDTLSYTKQNLRMVVGELEQTNQALDETRNTAYYVIGNKKELIAKKVLVETGSFLHKTVSVSRDFDTAAFTRIHIGKVNEFAVNCAAKEVKLMPAPSPSSYQLEETGKNSCVLKVTNPEQFWKMRFLVVLVKG
jgi:predicted  nucleic acid-binding Zn-ribbon protein